MTLADDPERVIGIDASRALRARRTGTENYSLQVIRHLLAIGGEHTFRLYCREAPPPGFFVPPGQDGSALDLRVLPFPRLWTHVRLSAEVARHRPDVLFVPSHVLPAWHPRRSVVTVHDLGYRHFPAAHRRFDRWYLEASTRFSARTAARVLADSRATRDDLVAAYGIDPAQVSVVYLGRDEALAPVEDGRKIAEVTARLGITDPYLLYVGTLQPRKNLERLVEAFSLALDSRDPAEPALQLVLAGNRGWLSDGIFRRVEALGLQAHVRFPGFVADEDLPALMTGARAFAFPSLYEGFGLPILEAQACGVPVLAANTSSLPEVAGDGALLVDPLDVSAIGAGLGQLVTDEELRRRLREAGFANIRRFSWQRCAEETLAILLQVAST